MFAPTIPTLNGSSCQQPKLMSFTVEEGRTITVTFKLLTPAQASEMLATLNTRNRKLNTKSAELIEEDIRDGEWKFTGDTIKIAVNQDGTRFLADAQHRLKAIANGGVPVPVLIVENLDPDVTDIIDQGKPRAVGDILRMTYGRKDIKNENTIAGIAMLLMVGYGMYSKPNRRQIAEYANNNIDDLTIWASWASSVSIESEKVQVRPNQFSSALTAAPLGALAVYMTDQGAPRELVTDFFFRIGSGLISDKDHTNVIPAIRKRQKNGVALARYGSGATMALFTEYAAYINAYNKWVIGEQVVVIKSPKTPVTSFDQLPTVSKFGR